jgi:hypothetical protein
LSGASPPGKAQKPALDPSSVKPGRWSKRKTGTERWVKPEMVVEIEFTEWTPETRAAPVVSGRAGGQAR